MTKPVFEINPQLLKDCHRLYKIDNFHVLLHKNATIPWIILVPETQDKELFQLSESMQQRYLQLVAAISSHFITTVQSEKMNIAAIGNIVEQLHIHVIARKSNDACWPHVVWGQQYTISRYSPEQRSNISDELFNAIANYKQ